jgi:hypothetical protein
MARGQDALTWELRIAISLARLFGTADLTTAPFQNDSGRGKDFSDATAYLAPHDGCARRRGGWT